MTTMTEPQLVPGETLWNDHGAFINKTVRDISRSFWKVEEEDVLQEIWVFLWEKEEYFVAHECSDAYIKKSIYHVALNYALRQRNKTLLETDTFYYGTDEVKELLPEFFSLYESWATAYVPDGYVTATRNDNVEVFCDFRLAWDRLTEPQQDVLQRRYGEDEDFSEAKDRQALSRATRRFVTLLNQHKDIEAKDHTGPGSRKPVSNAQGLYLAKSAVDD